MNKIATVVQGMLEIDSSPLIELNSTQWFEWLNRHTSFRYEPKSEIKGFTVRVEKAGYWYAYRKIKGKLHKRYIGKPEELTVERLEEIAVLLEEPPQPRQKSVTEKSAIKPSITSGNDDIAQLWQSLAELRSEVAALSKSRLAVAQESETTEQQGNDQSILEELQKTRSQIQQLHSEIKTIKGDNQQLHKKLQIAQEELQMRMTNSSLQEDLSSEIIRLEVDIASLRQSRDELIDEKIQWYESLRENAVLNTLVEQLQEEVLQLRSHSERLLLENSELQNQVSHSQAPDMNSIRSRVLGKLKMGKQSTAGKAIEAFIREMRHVETGSKASTSPSLTVEPIHPLGEELTTVTHLQPATWEARADNFLLEVAGNGEARVDDFLSEVAGNE
jgi:DNA repair exonuclease SbcCD ATPase subunit